MAKASLHFIIPNEIMENHVAILGKAGSGKTITAKGVAERLLKSNQRVCAIDPTGVWWGMKSSASGKSTGYPLTIFGGRHADFPIGRNHGAAIAEMVGTTDLSCIIDTRLMSVGERTQFFTDFAETLLRKNTSPLHLMIDEAHLFAPQGRVNDPQSGKMLHATNNLVSLGRAAGLRVTMITQRPAKLHKDSLTQAETLIAMRLIAPQDRRAIDEWVGEWAEKSEGAEILKSLPSLKTGEGWIWAPQKDLLRRVAFPMIETYDSSKAPDGTQSTLLMAPIDSKKIAEKLETIAANVLSDDPGRLKKRIAELEKEVAKKATAKPSDADLKEAHQDGRKVGFADGYSAGMAELREKIEGVLENIPQQLDLLRSETVKKPVEKEKKAPIAKAIPQENSGMGRCELAILNVLGQFPQGRNRKQIGILSGYKHTSGGFNTALAKLRASGMIEGSGQICITSAGLPHVSGDPLPHGRDLVDYWVGRLGKCDGRILEYLYESGPASRQQIGEALEYSPTSGGFNTALAKLRALELIGGGANDITISPDFFE